MEVNLLQVVKLSALLLLVYAAKAYQWGDWPFGSRNSSESVIGVTWHSILNLALMVTAFDAGFYIIHGSLTLDLAIACLATLTIVIGFSSILFALKRGSAT
jgi:hypothetical protein